jgi:flavodoxin I
MIYVREENVMATAIFYASNTGNTATIAQEISNKLGDVPYFDIAESGIAALDEYDKLIFGTCTWGDGELPDDWLDIFSDFSKLDFSNKTVAFFGLGDQEGYEDNFLDAVGILYNKVFENGAKVVGSWDVSDDYEFENSLAVQDGKFVGLALDEDNQDDLTEERISLWCEQIQSEIL